jgi:hypothetical protein
MTFRHPIFHRIPARFAAPAEYVVNLNLVLHFPNPTRPWVQSDWPRPTGLPKLKAVGEPIGRVSPLLTPNPTRPWSQYDWPAPARIPLSLKSDSYWGGPPLYYPNPPQPFRQNLWEGERPLPKAIGEALGGDAPLLTPNPGQPFTQADWPSLRATVRAKVDDFANLLPFQQVVTVSAPFNQDLWDSTTRALPKVTGEVVGTLAPLLTPNPPSPFVQADWPSLAAARRPAIPDTSNQGIFVTTAAFNQPDWLQPPPQRQKATVDTVVNLLPLQSGVVVVAAPFYQNDWPNAAKPWIRAVGEAASGGAPLLTPNPPQPFSQADWLRASFAQKAKGDDLTNLVPLYSVVVTVVAPFYQNLWDNAARIPAKAIGEAIGGNAPILTPNPAQPFNQTEWLRAPFAVKAKVDDGPNLLPLQSGAPIIVPQPFSLADWPLPYRPNPASAGGDPPLATLLSLLYAVQPQPFVQTDWQTPRYSSAGSRSAAAIGGAPTTAPETNTDWLMRARRRGLR